MASSGRSTSTGDTDGPTSFDLAADSDAEKGRLEKLEEYQILDTPPERAYDHVAQVASYLFDAPIGAVTLIDEERQWLKACVGMDNDDLGLESSLCARNIQSPGVLVVENAAEEEPFASMPVVDDPDGIRFYVGAPLETPDGHRIGTLCVLDTEPRSRPDQEKIDHLKNLAQIVVDELELRRESEKRRRREEALVEAREQAEKARSKAEEARIAEKKARKEAERADRSKTRFLAGVAHDLRSPLSAISGLAEVLQQSLAGEEARHARRIRRATRQLSAMTDSLTDLMRLESGNIDLELEPDDLRPLVEDAAAALEVRAAEADIEFEVDLPDEPAIARVNSSAFRRVVDNLAGNAIKYSSAGDSVAVRLAEGSGEPGANSAGAGEIALTVTDTGPGIDPEFLPNLFEPFERESEHGEGMGLGMAVAKELVDAMNGRIHVDSVPEEGTAARVMLRLARTPGEADRDSRSRAAGDAGRPRTEPDSSQVCISR